MKPLIVDDERSMPVDVGTCLRSVGYDADGAHPREQARGLTSRVRYDGVIVGLGLTAAPGTDRLDVAADVWTGGSSARLVILTAGGATETQAEARRRGVDAFPPEPLAPGERHGALVTVLGVSA